MLISSSFLLFKIHTVQLSIIITGNLVGLLRSVISLKPCYTFSENGSVNTNPLCLVVRRGGNVVKRMNIVCIKYINDV